MGYSAGSYSRSASWMMTMSPCTCAQAGAHRRALALLTRCLNRRMRPSRASLFQNRARAVGGAIVHGDDLFAQRHRLHLLHDLANRARLVVDRHDDRIRKSAGMPVSGAGGSRAGPTAGVSGARAEWPSRRAGPLPFSLLSSVIAYCPARRAGVSGGPGGSPPPCCRRCNSCWSFCSRALPALIGHAISGRQITAAGGSTGGAAWAV